MSSRAPHEEVPRQPARDWLHVRTRPFWARTASDARERIRALAGRAWDAARTGLGSAKAAAGRAGPQSLPPRAALVGAGVLAGGALVLAVSLGGTGKRGTWDERAGREAQDPVSTGSVPRAEPGGGSKAVRLIGFPEVIDTATLRINGRIARLFGVEWARGGQAGELAAYLGGRQVDCAPAREPDVFRCTVDGRDLSEVVLYNGGGVAAADAPAELAAAEARAKSERVGVWRR